MAPHGEGVHASKLARALQREGINNRLSEITVAQGTPEAEFFCECADVACEEFVTMSLAEFHEARAAGRPVIFEGHRSSIFEGHRSFSARWDATTGGR